MMIYVHVPFCEKKCNYCAFNSKTGDAEEKNFYVDALIREINLRGQRDRVETIYFGGGTPTTLTLVQLEKIICAVVKNFSVDEDAEITIEANPGTVDENYLRGLKSLGFIILSIERASFYDDLCAHSLLRKEMQLLCVQFQDERRGGEKFLRRRFDSGNKFARATR